LADACKEILRRFSIIDAADAETASGKKVSEFGKKVSALGKKEGAFAFLHTLFATPVVKLTEKCGNNNDASIFACFVFDLIENANALISHSMSQELVDPFCAVLDIVPLDVVLKGLLADPELDEKVEVVMAAGFQALSILKLCDRLAKASAVLFRKIAASTISGEVGR